MLECISDYLSFALLMAFPTSWIVWLVVNFIGTDEKNCWRIRKNIIGSGKSWTVRI